MKLLSVCANNHVVDGRRVGAPLRLLLAFEDGSVLRMGAASDGETMVVDREPLDQPFEVEPYGKVVIEDVTALLDPALGGATVGGTRWILLDGRQVGIALMLDGRDPLCLWVDGDELWWGDDHALMTHIWPGERTPLIGEPVAV